MIEGWDDKGKFDFIVAIWHINQHLPPEKGIKIVAVDTPRPFSVFRSEKDMDSSDAKYDSNAYMAAKILTYLHATRDKRHMLFTVGTGHVFKTGLTAANQLSIKMPGDVYTIFTHAPRIEEGRKFYERLRHGAFDYAFLISGDRPRVFELKNSPFGSEPFDALFDEGDGSYADNYDGYIYFGSLDKEPSQDIRFAEYDGPFILEMDRRFRLLPSSLEAEWGIKALTREAVTKLLAEHSKTRWQSHLKPFIGAKTTAPGI